jgi:hypothetical protein
VGIKAKGFDLAMPIQASVLLNIQEQDHQTSPRPDHGLTQTTAQDYHVHHRNPIINHSYYLICMSYYQINMKIIKFSVQMIKIGSLPMVCSGISFEAIQCPYHRSVLTISSKT